MRSSSLFSTLLLLLLLGSASVFAGAPEKPLSRYEYRQPEMGMPFRLVLYADGQSAADRAAAAAFQRIRQLNDIMSDYDPDSELSRLSRSSGQGRAVQVSQDLWTVLERAQTLAEQSGGAFDVTVGPYVVLWRRARRQHELPDPVRLAEAKQAVGFQYMRLHAPDHTVELRVANMRLDLGGIAKGYAVDQALKVLREQGIRQALIEAGGDMGVSEPPPGKPAWRIELTSVDASNAPPARFLSLKDHAISTSGDLYQRLEINGTRYSHLIDPHTGIGLTNHCVVNIVAPDGITSDSLTKVVSILGPLKGLQYVQRVAGVEARIMWVAGGRVEVAATEGFARFYAN